jgi:hypothetical protein
MIEFILIRQVAYPKRDDYSLLTTTICAYWIKNGSFLPIAQIYAPPVVRNFFASKAVVFGETSTEFLTNAVIETIKNAFIYPFLINKRRAQSV